MRGTIRLEKLVRERHGLVYEFDSTVEGFKRRSFFVRYERQRPSGNDSLDVLPFAALAAPVAWAWGADLVLPAVDAAFADSLAQAEGYFRRRFAGRWAFGGALEARRCENRPEPSGTAMLFSGGLDSLATFARNRDRSPELFTVFGTDIPLRESGFIAFCRSRFDAFARAKGVPVRYVRTDARDVLDTGRLLRHTRNWYGEVAHGLLMASLLAPVASGRVRTLLVAGCSHRPGSLHACGSDHELIGGLRWGGTALVNDGHSLSRLEKVREHLAGDRDARRCLRVCWSQFETLNCGRCEKCLRTVLELLANNIDPVECNFAIDRGTLPALKRRLSTRLDLFLRGETTLDFWRAIQDGVRPEEVRDLYGSRAFFEWFKGFRALRRRQNPLVVSVLSAAADARRALESLRAAAPVWQGRRVAP